MDATCVTETAVDLACGGLLLLALLSFPSMAYFGLMYRGGF
ncbi:MAG TPA: hypothetical protein VIF43_04425 [Patescibacteria group bacterium]|jgi:hypothetical protein